VYPAALIPAGNTNVHFVKLTGTGGTYPCLPAVELEWIQLYMFNSVVQGPEPRMLDN